MIGNSFMPSSSGSASLGTENNAWKDIYLMIKGTPKSLIDILTKGGLI
jgi:hypothetical protein